MNFSELLKRRKVFSANDWVYSISFFYLTDKIENSLKKFRSKNKYTLKKLINELEQNGIPCHEVQDSCSPEYAVAGTCLTLGECDGKLELTYRHKTQTVDTIDCLALVKEIKKNYPLWKTSLEDLFEKHENELNSSILEIWKDQSDKDSHYRSYTYLRDQLSLYSLLYPRYLTNDEQRSNLRHQGLDIQAETIHLKNCDILPDYDITCIPHKYPEIHLDLSHIELTKEMIEEIDERIPSWIGKFAHLETMLQKEKKIRKLETKSIQLLVKNRMETYQHEYTLEAFKPCLCLTIKAENQRFASCKLPYNPLECEPLIEQLHQAVLQINTIPENVFISIYPGDMVWTKP